MISKNVTSYHVTKIKKDLVWQFGDKSDGAIEFAGIVDKGYIEIGYFYGESKPKNILVVSTQVGCPSKCSFCELGDSPFIRSLTPDEIFEQIVMMLQQAHSYGFDIDLVKHKVNFAKSGDALFNPHFVDALKRIEEFGFSYKIATVFPHGKIITERFKAIADYAANYGQPIQIQVSLISTNEDIRNKTAGIKVASFPQIREAAEYWRSQNTSRKINLSLILTENDPVNVTQVYNTFPPELFRFRFRNYVPTQNGKSKGLETITKATFENVYNQFKEKGYDVGTWATPTPIEQRFSLASNVTLRRYKQFIT